MLKDSFLNKFKGLDAPFTPLGEFVYYRTYSRFLPQQGRRETWQETCKRAVNYNTSLANTSEKEKEELFENMFYLRQFLSGRTLWVGGTEASTKYPLSNFNCAFVVMDDFAKMRELFYLLMIGTGVGVRVLPSDVIKLPKVRTDVEIEHLEYTRNNNKQEVTSLEFKDQEAIITIGDSKEGWIQSLEAFFNILSRKDYRHIDKISFCYNHIRPRGERLKTFGGTASGYDSLKNMFEKIDKIIKGKLCENYPKVNDNKLRPIHIFDIVTSIGQNVVVGGVRRTALNHLIGAEDKELIEAKNDVHNQPELFHRFMSNNSIYYMQKPSREMLEWQLQTQRYNGEPGFLNAEAASKRRENFCGVNPCFEILLDDRGLCNLTTVNVMAFVKDGKILEKELLHAQELSARASFRMTCVELEIHQWDIVQKRDRLTGTSLTGWQDMLAETGISNTEAEKLLQKLKEVAQNSADEYAKELGVTKSLLVTTVKPEGTLSQLPTVSSGLHYAHAPYFIRRVRINSNDALVKVAQDLGWKVVPEVGQTWENATTLVIEFPVHSPTKKTKFDTSAVEQLNTYLSFQRNYTAHNTSNTVTVQDHEWEEVANWLWNNWDETIAVSFLPLTNHVYPLAPYQEISKAEYEEMVKTYKPFDKNLLSAYEQQETLLDIGDEACETGACPVR